MEPTKTFSIRLTEKQLKELKKIADKEGRKVNNLIQKMILEGIERRKSL